MGKSSPFFILIILLPYAGRLTGAKPMHLT